MNNLQKNETGYKLSVGVNTYHAQNVIIATGAFHTPYIPSIAQELDSSIFQLHSTNYHKPADVNGQDILVVGAGNSGAEIENLSGLEYNAIEDIEYLLNKL